MFLKHSSKAVLRGTGVHLMVSEGSDFLTDSLFVRIM